ncbi:imidazolonepropionase-like amidohydrolase [Edaphobacter aggregans]|uniref:Imidazolonepropionase-like amidohydrolase n=1 Tax=Edaphobacter aggregans TaxID=570835 RepID=A0A3R9R331_9BACT|nr:amidohydrolase family protein [Edaphobacter aggregans]RSL16806.1 imidazolonepropionase-like amidohydrolase [Edaphobacter aggregans]
MDRRHTAALAICLATAAITLPAQTPTPPPAVAKFIKINGPRTLLTHVRIIDGTGGAPLEDQSILIEGGKITSISSTLPTAAQAQVLDLHGYTAIPGLVGMHDHMYYIARPNFDALGNSEPPLIVPQMTFSAPRMYLAAGVTTLRTTGSVEPYTDLNLRREIDAGHLPGPHMDVTGPYLEGPNSPFLQMHNLRDAEDARQTVRFWAAQGVTSFKAYMNITRDELKAAIDEAHKLNLKVTGHLCSVTYPEAAELGIDNLEHGFVVNTQLDPDKQADLCPKTSGTPTRQKMLPDSPEAKALFKLLIDHHVAITSTLPVFEADGNGRPPLEPRILAAMTPQAREAYLYVRNLQSTAPAARQNPNPRAVLFQRELDMERAFAAAGGTLLAGPDPTGDGHVLPGYGDQREVELLVQAGFTPVEAIKIATLNGATYLNQQPHIGSIAPGKNADLVVIKGDPSTKISDIENVEIVFKDGVGYDSAKLLDSIKGRYGQY